MNLVCISDTHCQHGVLDLPAGDVLIHAGDWTHRGEEHLVIKFLEWFEAQKHPHKLFIAGNHDFYPEVHPAEFRALVTKYAPTCNYLEESSITIDGYKFYGSPITPWFNDWAFNRHRGDEIQQHWDRIPEDTDVLITHGPVLGYGDKLARFNVRAGENVGCANLLHTVDNRLKNLKLHVCGHIHEGAGVYDHNGIIMVNASVLDERYRMRNSPVILTLSDKVVVSDPNTA